MQENDSESAQKAAGEQDRLRLFLKSAEHGAQRLLQFLQNGAHDGFGIRLVQGPVIRPEDQIEGQGLFPVRDALALVHVK